MDSFILKTSVLTLVVIILSACAATSRNTKHIGLYQYVTRDSHIVNSFKAGDFQEARKIITLETNYLRLFFEQTYEPIFGAPKWNKECLKANKIAGARIEGDEIYAISELFVHYNGSVGHCGEGPQVFRAHHVMVYCPVYKEVIVYKFQYDPKLNFEEIDLCK